MDISWNQLNEQGFIFGRPITIDGVLYLCRSLKVGVEESVPNEWDDLLDEFVEEDATWHWRDSFFWGQETPTAGAVGRVLRGYYSARYWNSTLASTRDAYLGFRPVLEPLSPEPLISDNLVGTKLQIWGPTGSVSGPLSDLTDYDLVLMDATQDITPSNWCSLQPDGSLIIDRAAISYIRVV